ncbi:MAG TPA: glycosyltransferase, partial [Bacteroidia bacterium]|nr:glycosyltransferase [Bacteroidia bacterium]
GRLVPIKNHKLFIDAISYVKAHTNQKIRAFIIGDGETRSSLEKKVNDLNLRDLILFTSWEKNIDMVYPGLDIVCLTSLNEGTPVSLIEAQAASKPIVSTDVGGITNVVIPNRTAFISPVADEVLFMKNLLTLVENRSMRDEMSLSGYDFVINRFSYQRLIADTEALYKKLLNK